MRILYHHRTQGEEPESVHIAAIVTALRRMGHEVDVVGPGRIATQDGRSRPTLLGRVKRSAPRALIELAQLAFNALSFAQLTAAMRRRQYDFVYERYALYNIAGVMAARLFGLPLVLEVNTLYARAWTKYYGLRFRRLAHTVERWALRSADLVITVSDAQRGMLEGEGVVPERIIVSHNAIDPHDFETNRFRASELRQRLRLPPIVAGFVGTMNRWQGVQGFADVISRVAAQRRDVGFLFIGDGEGRSALQSELQRCGLGEAAFFVGRQPHAAIPQYLAAMDIGLLLDSNAYGSPMKIFEYWAMGLPVVAPSVAPVLEVLRDGETGLLIRPGDAAQMADRILTLAGDPALRARLGDAGRKRVLAAHTWDQNAAKALDALAIRSDGRAGELRRHGH